MLSREEFIFTIGYDGPSAVVDRQARKKYGSLSTRELAEKGFYRAAYSSAVYSQNPDELKLIADLYNRLGASGTEASPGYELPAFERLFGVSLVDVKRSVLI